MSQLDNFFSQAARPQVNICEFHWSFTVFSMVFRVDVFKDNQKDVEMATETLSEYLERDISSENLSCIKQKVQDKYRCDNK